jgi:flagellar basal body-associated protein FliL
MKKIYKILIYLVIFGLVCGFGVYMYVFHKPHRNVGNEKPAFTLTASELIKEFSEKEDVTYKLYGDKALQVTGKIADITKKGNEITVILEDKTSGVSCSFEAEYYQNNTAAINALKIGDPLTVKGKCDGYDMIMGVVLTRCVLP